MTDLEQLAGEMTEQELLELFDLKYQEHMELASKHEALANRYAAMITEFGGRSKAASPKRSGRGKHRPGRPKGSRNKRIASEEPQVE